MWKQKKPLLTKVGARETILCSPGRERQEVGRSADLCASSTSFHATCCILPTLLTFNAHHTPAGRAHRCLHCTAGLGSPVTMATASAALFIKLSGLLEQHSTSSNHSNRRQQMTAIQWVCICDFCCTSNKDISSFCISLPILILQHLVAT